MTTKPTTLADVIATLDTAMAQFKTFTGKFYAELNSAYNQQIAAKALNDETLIANTQARIETAGRAIRATVAQYHKLNETWIDVRQHADGLFAEQDHKAELLGDLQPIRKPRAGVVKEVKKSPDFIADLTALAFDL